MKECSFTRVQQNNCINKKAISLGMRVLKEITLAQTKRITLLYHGCSQVPSLSRKVISFAISVVKFLQETKKTSAHPGARAAR